MSDPPVEPTEILYDEFGNYIGPELDDDDDDESSEEESNDSNDEASKQQDETTDQQQQDSQQQATTVQLPPSSSAIVLHEDKEYYQSTDATYGPDVRAVVVDEDAMDLEDTPILAPASPLLPETISNNNDSALQFHSTNEYLGLMFASDESPRNQRNIAIVGHFHHGKTSLVDVLIEPTLTQSWDTARAADEAYPRYLDTLTLEQERGLSVHATPISLLLPDTRGKSTFVNLLDCPGHPQFHDETCAALRLCDGAVLVVDVVEGIQMHTEMSLRQIVHEGLPLVLVLSKMDRLVCELQLPPTDAYYKILHVVSSINELLVTIGRGRYPPLAPDRGNVALSSARHGWLVTLPAFAEVARDHGEYGIGTDQLAARLWGDCCLNETTGQFVPYDGSRPRTFVRLFLEPLYKIYSACLGEDDPEPLLRKVGVLLRRDALRSSARPLLRRALAAFLGVTGFADMLQQHLPHPGAAAPSKLRRGYPGGVVPSQQQQLLVHCGLHLPDQQWTLARVYHGTLRTGDTVKVLGEGYETAEDAATATITALAIPRGRFHVPVRRATAGNWVLVRGVDATISKTATLVKDVEEESRAFLPLSFPQTGAVVKLSLEPLNPAELPKMVEGLRRITKAYPMATTKVEESGEHVLYGTGELQLDCIMDDLRNEYAKIEIKVADPIVAFRETVLETSAVKCFAETANKRNKLTMIAEPLDEGLAEQLELGNVSVDWDKKKMGRYFQQKYQWDLLSSRSVWAFGDSPKRGTNLLMDDTLPTEVDKGLLSSCRSSIVQGFQWATREGPLCEEPVRGTKIKILDATLADKAIFRGGGQLIPTARRTVHASLVSATPRLLEPMYRLDIVCPGSIVESIQPVLARRRGHTVQDRPLPGTTLSIVKGYLPVLDSFGFETDLRMFTQGQAMVYSIFDHWSVVPGDPLDDSILLHPLEPSPPHALSRELLVKTRRRKGLSEDVNIGKYMEASSYVTQ